MSLRELEQAVPALLDIRSAERRNIDWEFIQRETGVVLPPDFVALAETYPPFTVNDFLGLHIPSPGEEKYFLAGVQELLGNLAELRNAGMSHGHVPFPEPGGLLPWGDSSEGDVFYWKTSEADSASWSVLVSGRNDDWCAYAGGMTSYLAGLVRGTVPPDGLPPEFPSSTPVIEAD
ncbi:SMI1/KNR4 family protein [Nocardia sp. NBC_00565]|uniref:hypothetical protein n=1 Tax=Nocardia sp. NBC_00565 TaxID=2975993 RepID=UPI002E81C07E|nr:hypothetical protein [Nocardia sp. NBC_00565]WUC01384.1 SMI1/KNR4 family protein [Nocardia sp. NBC_00565]